MIMEVKWVMRTQRGEGTARVKDILTAFWLSDSEQTIIFSVITIGHGPQ